MFEWLFCRSFSKTSYPDSLYSTTCFCTKKGVQCRRHVCSQRCETARKRRTVSGEKSLKRRTNVYLVVFGKKSALGLHNPCLLLSIPYNEQCSLPIQRCLFAQRKATTAPEAQDATTDPRGRGRSVRVEISFSASMGGEPSSVDRES